MLSIPVTKKHDLAKRLEPILFEFWVCSLIGFDKIKIEFSDYNSGITYGKFYMSTPGLGIFDSFANLCLNDNGEAYDLYSLISYMVWKYWKIRVKLFDKILVFYPRALAEPPKSLEDSEMGVLPDK